MAYKVQLPAQRVAEQYLSGSPIPEQVVTAATAVTSNSTEYSVATHELGTAYRRYRSMPESEPLETFRVAYREIAGLEAQATPETAWRILRETATAFHAETGICPFCRIPGPLHLPADQLSMELRDGK